MNSWLATCPLDHREALVGRHIFKYMRGAVRPVDGNLLSPRGGPQAESQLPLAVREIAAPGQHLCRLHTSRGQHTDARPQRRAVSPAALQAYLQVVAARTVIAPELHRSPISRN